VRVVVGLVGLIAYVCYLEVTEHMAAETRLRFVPMQTERLPGDHTDPERHTPINFVETAAVVSTSTQLAASASQDALGIRLYQVAAPHGAPYTIVIIPPESQSA